MKKIIYGFLFFSAALMAVSCGSGSDKEILKYTTDKTLAIVKINVSQLEKKLPKDEMMKDQSSKMSKEDKEKMTLIMDAKNNGLDTDKPFYILADSEGDGFAVSLIGFISDKAKFEAGFSKITEKKIKVNDSNNVYADDKLIGSIKDDMIVFTGVVGNPMAMAYGYGGSSGGEADAAFYANFWKRKATENKTKVEQIEKSLNNKADMSTWVNLYGIINTASRGYIETLAINKQLIDAGMGFDLNFNEGSIDIKASTFFNKEMQTLVKKYYDGKEADYSLVKNIDIDKAQAYGVGFVSFEFLRNFIKDAGFESMVNEGMLQNIGLSLDDVTGGLKGTYAFASYGEIPAEEPVIEEEPVLEASMEADPYADEYGYEDYDDYPVYKPAIPNVVFAFGIDGAKAQKLVDFISKNEMFAAYVKTYANKDIFVVSTSDSNLDLFKSGKAAANKNLTKKTGVNSYSWMGGEQVNTLAQGKMKAKLVNIESFSKMEGGNSTSEVTIKFDKNKKNILHYLLGYE